MIIKKSEGCACDKPHIKEKFEGRNCSLNQIIKCHGDQPIDELINHLEIETED
ncbi:MAG: hypothetical protein GF317_05510 [Candidatus Lokiarchaeota archaeon]|nr:hypothetical protein [Candidatus Lokiarchaeota archaeon]MBD3199264.1 hypothetical protein [Candidatus Lokiarchaeota archaeon]